MLYVNNPENQGENWRKKEHGREIRI